MGQDVPDITLRDGNVMPQLGFGTCRLAAADCPKIVGDAIRAGYRSIDTASDYGNEDGVGTALRDSVVPRPELFVISRLRRDTHSRDQALRSFDETMKRLRLEQLDMLLLDGSEPDRAVEAWTTLVELQQQGHTRSIGVANFDTDHIERITRETGIAPVLHRLELHPMFQQRDKRGYHRRRGIAIQSASPLAGSAAARLLDNPAIAQIAERHGKTPAQIVIRWHLDEGSIVFPKSARTARIAENLAVLDFKLDAEDMYRIEALDNPEAGSIGSEPRDRTLTA